MPSLSPRQWRKVFEGGQLNVRRENNLGNHSNGWLYDVYFTLLLFFVSDHLFRKDHLL